jgi:hypothetical protein
MDAMDVVDADAVEALTLRFRFTGITSPWYELLHEAGWTSALTIRRTKIQTLVTLASRRMLSPI